MKNWRLKIIQLKNLLYILQLAEYDVAYFLNWVKAHPHPSWWLNLEKKAKLKWTLKARLIFIISSVLSFFSFRNSKNLPAILVFALKIISLFERIRKWQVVNQAKRKLLKYKNLKKIGVAGSFGKTTAKEYLAHILSQKYKVIKTPENINTILGVANFILKTNFQEADIFVVEIGAYFKGDVQKLCDVIKPQIGVLTGIGHEHIERFKDMENILSTELEIIESLQDQNLAIIPQLLIKELKNKIKNNNIELKTFGLNNKNSFNIKNLKWGVGDCDVDIYYKDVFYFKAKVPVVAPHQLELALAALVVADKLNLNKVEIKLALESLPAIPRRLCFNITDQDIWILDDSYNITIEGAQAALEVLNRLSLVSISKDSSKANTPSQSFKDEQFKSLPNFKRRRVVLSAGIPESGNQKEQIHYKLGALYQKYCDLLLLVENSTTSYIIKGMKDVASSQEVDVKIFKDAKKAQEALKQILKPGDIILIQAYDWPDHYY